MMVVCPRDGASLVEVNKSGVQIDVCPECKGVWLDRGELEKIMQITRDLEREFADPPRAQAVVQPQPRPEYREEPRPEYRDSRGYRRDDDDDERDDDYGKRKRKSGLSKLFDIFD